jgi:hypothetical protein
VLLARVLQGAGLLGAGDPQWLARNFAQLGLAVMVVRVDDLGATPNRVAALGLNLVLLLAPEVPRLARPRGRAGAPDRVRVRLTSEASRATSGQQRAPGT